MKRSSTRISPLLSMFSSDLVLSPKFDSEDVKKERQVVSKKQDGHGKPRISAHDISRAVLARTFSRSSILGTPDHSRKLGARALAHPFPGLVCSDHLSLPPRPHITHQESDRRVSRDCGTSANPLDEVPDFLVACVAGRGNEKMIGSKPV